MLIRDMFSCIPDERESRLVLMSCSISTQWWHSFHSPVGLQRMRSLPDSIDAIWLDSVQGGQVLNGLEVWHLGTGKHIQTSHDHRLQMTHAPPLFSVFGAPANKVNLAYESACTHMRARPDTSCLPSESLMHHEIQTEQIFVLPFGWTVLQARLSAWVHHLWRRHASTMRQLIL